MGCGFSPLYARGGEAPAAGSVSEDLSRIRIAPIKDRLGQQLRNALVQRITPRGEPADYLYILTVTVSESTTDLGYRRDNLATLGNLTLSANINVQGDGFSIYGGVANSVASFDYIGPRYASIANERDARDRAIVQLADDIRGQVAAAIARYRANPGDVRYRRGDSVDYLGRRVSPPAERR
ncbi:LPS assembly lipoprotein LptE [Magnetospirillum sp. SS-4]|uniref:LPS assembly lipoprotein LptE n=1 Tax=Magnetospirillum sp. SS-4 TaxID=2681465 RepID=UPI0015726308|nr:LPS assembly lipoprotein LptE [Magnetospirillum sp. SS-4]